MDTQIEKRRTPKAGGVIVDSKRELDRFDPILDNREIRGYANRKAKDTKSGGCYRGF